MPIGKRGATANHLLGGRADLWYRRQRQAVVFPRT